MKCFICGTNEFFSRVQGMNKKYTLCDSCGKAFTKIFREYRDTHRLSEWSDPYEGVELEPYPKSYPAPCYLCGTLRDHEQFKPYSQYHYCPWCLNRLKRFCDGWIIKQCREQKPKYIQELL
jgi:uncharacterized CHY-type Zn-finger protein